MTLLASHNSIIDTNAANQHIQDLALYNFDNGVSWGSRVSTIDHYINSTKGTNSGLLRVRATVKNHGCVRPQTTPIYLSTCNPSARCLN